MIISLHHTQLLKKSVWAAVILACCFLTSGAWAAKAPAAAGPEVLVLISAEQNAWDRVAITYAGNVSEQRARQDLRALLAATGWEANSLAVDSERLAPGEPKTTSVEFVAPAVVPYPEGVLPVASLIQTYKAHRSLVLIFQTQRPYRFIGPGAYQSPQLTVRLQQSPGSYRYDVQIADPGFKTLNLPNVALPAAPAGAQTRGKAAPPLFLVLLLALGAALSMGVVVYLLTAKRGARPARSAAARKEAGRRSGRAG